MSTHINTNTTGQGQHLVGKGTLEDKTKADINSMLFTFMDWQFQEVREIAYSFSWPSLTLLKHAPGWHCGGDLDQEGHEELGK